MTESDTIAETPFEITFDGKVRGMITKSLSNDYYVTGSVISYSFTRSGDEQMNHVPHIVVCDESGSIISEPHTHDSQNAKTAIENAVSMVNYIQSHEHEFIDV